MCKGPPVGELWDAVEFSGDVRYTRASWRMELGRKRQKVAREELPVMRRPLL